MSLGKLLIVIDDESPQAASLERPLYCRNVYSSVILIIYQRPSKKKKLTSRHLSRSNFIKPGPPLHSHRFEPAQFCVLRILHWVHSSSFQHRPRFGQTAFDFFESRQQKPHRKCKSSISSPSQTNKNSRGKIRITRTRLRDFYDSRITDFQNLPTPSW